MSFAYHGLTRLPASIAGGRVRELDLTGNRFGELPEAIRRMPALERLYLDDNQLTSLPGWIADLPALRELHLRRNRLAAVPEVVVGLGALKDLRLGANQLSDLPNALWDLRELQTLDLCENQIARCRPLCSPRFSSAGASSSDKRTFGVASRPSRLKGPSGPKRAERCVR